MTNRKIIVDNSEEKNNSECIKKTGKTVKTVRQSSIWRSFKAYSIKRTEHFEIPAGHKYGKPFLEHSGSELIDRNSKFYKECVTVSMTKKNHLITFEFIDLLPFQLVWI